MAAFLESGYFAGSLVLQTGHTGKYYNKTSI